ncbi:class I SAM-dependent methyltransferase [Pisciglobus halotolerans]|uniref:Site-specific DNA-methyltransferase (Adenine-specific) n=1 Tax=Pisciglobus halotolerans TaxID=745365 RepID=A0A1I3BV98_9LACT|nr:class I SAM-dependent methyltransferase [Pisciglobus halotolerans]SFH66162.1 site-specific DNA-methyltransferase (adenine-specific) [Pisciglobus halotolerans]
MSQKDIENLYHQLNESVQCLQSNLDWSYLEALAETGENIIEQALPEELAQILKPASAEKLLKIYQEVDLEKMSAEEIRKSFQLALLKGTKEDKLQTNHQLTPDAIGFLFVYLLDKVRDKSQKKLRLLDLAVGTGNLLETIYNALIAEKIEVEAEGIENDDLLISLAAVSSFLQKQKIKLTHQDAVQDLLVDPVDIVLSDLPVGYYPIDERAKDFQTAAAEGHSFVHHLLIEQSFHYLKEDGFGLFLVPSLLFETSESPALMKMIQHEGYLQGFLHLPKELFANEQSRKSILLVQKKGAHAKQAKQVLLAQIPELKNQAAMVQFMQEVNKWEQENL